MLPKNARVLNVSRGGIIDEAALAEALKQGIIAGAAIDVFSKEPPSPDNPLLKAPNIVLTPHLGASTVEAQEAVAIEAAPRLQVQPIKREFPKVGRNDPCPCGSGKKYKQCHGK